MTETEKITLLLVEDHRLVRESFANLLKLKPEFEVVGEAASGEEALEKVDRLKPEIILMDIKLPGISGIEATKIIKEKYPEIEVIILSMYDEDEYVLEAVKAGASGYVLKSISDTEELFQAIKVVHSGGYLIQPQLAKKILQNFTRASKNLPKGKISPLKEISEREIEVLEHVAQGKSNKEIAEILFISEKTVKAHLRTIFRKLEVADRAQAVAYAMRKGWVE